MLFDTPQVYHVEYSIFGVPVKCAGVGAAKFQKTHTCGAGVCGVKSYCAQSVRVCQNCLHTNTLDFQKWFDNVFNGIEAF